MGRKRYTSEQIVHLLRGAEVLTYGGLDVSQARRPKELEQENARLRHLVGEQALDIAILKEMSRGN